MKAPGADESVYYYHGDHLGSSSVVTNGAGAFHEGLEYFPYGETWVHASASPGSQSMPYRFTSKEQDPETGLYYFGARYYDARLSKWISTDPALGSYLPGAGEGDDDLPGIGGVFNPVNMNVYHYGGNNPLIYIDPDGEKVYYIHREIGDGKTDIRHALWNPAAHAFIATVDTNGVVKYAASWNKINFFSSEVGKWNTSGVFLASERKVAEEAIRSGKAVLLTNDDKLDPYIEKALSMLSLHESPSNHRFGQPATCQGESARLVNVADQIYMKETGTDYKGFTFWGNYLTISRYYLRLNDQQFNQLYNKAFMNGLNINGSFNSSSGKGGFSFSFSTGTGW